MFLKAYSISKTKKKLFDFVRTRNHEDRKKTKVQTILKQSLPDSLKISILFQLQIVITPFRTHLHKQLEKYFLL